MCYGPFKKVPLRLNETKDLLAFKWLPSSVETLNQKFDLPIRRMFASTFVLLSSILSLNIVSSIPLNLSAMEEK